MNIETDIFDVQTINVKKYFKNVKAVDGININIKKGEFTALLGPNGAGKTTLAEMIEGIQKPDSGEIFIQGKSWDNNEKELRKILGISLQETYFFEKVTVLETLKLFASFYNLTEDRIKYILNLTNLTQKKDIFVTNLSGGQKQKLALGIALLHNSQILILDEPTTGLDPSARREIWNILMDLKNQNNTSMILTTHYMEEAEFLCDRIIIMDQGKVLAEGTLDYLLSKFADSEIIEFSICHDFNDEVFLNTDEIKSYEWDEKTKKGIITVNNIVKFLPLFLDKIKNENIKLNNLQCRKMTLDDLFISMTGRRLDQ